MRPLHVSLLFLPAFAIATIALAPVTACDNAAAEAVVVNELGANDPPITLEKVWFRTTLFTRPVAPGESSETLRIGTGVEYAYAVIRVGQDDPDGGPPARRYVARTREPVDAQPATVTSIVFSATGSQSLCFGAPPLTREDWNFVTSRIFPSEQVEPYDPASCAAPPGPAPDASADASTDAPNDAPADASADADATSPDGG
jgi:hypothetical protein